MKSKKVSASAAKSLTSAVSSDVSLTAHTKQTSRNGNLLVVTGPSGVGKGTLISQLLAMTQNVAKSVSVTTRAKRKGEVEGVDYFFVSTEEFASMVAESRFLEYAEYTGCMYGTPELWVANRLKSGIDVILEIEVLGAMQIRKKFPRSVLIFISPPSASELESRIRNRATEPEDTILMRLSKAREELQARDMFDYEVINDNLDEAAKILKYIVYAERHRIFNR